MSSAPKNHPMNSVGSYHSRGGGVGSYYTTQKSETESNRYRETLRSIQKTQSKTFKERERPADGIVLNIKEIYEVNPKTGLRYAD